LALFSISTKRLVAQGGKMIFKKNLAIFITNEKITFAAYLDPERHILWFMADNKIMQPLSKAQARFILADYRHYFTKGEYDEIAKTIRSCSLPERADISIKETTSKDIPYLVEALSGIVKSLATDLIKITAKKN
jgi:hypothetical protein